MWTLILIPVFWTLDKLFGTFRFDPNDEFPPRVRVDYNDIEYKP